MISELPWWLLSHCWLLNPSAVMRGEFNGGMRKKGRREERKLGCMDAEERQIWELGWEGGKEG
jgi:hypothetical protein